MLGEVVPGPDMLGLEVVDMICLNFQYSVQFSSTDWCWDGLIRRQRQLGSGFIVNSHHKAPIESDLRGTGCWRLK